MYLVHTMQPACLLTPTPLRWSTLSPLRAKRVGRKGKYKNPLYACVERVVGRSHDRVSLRSRIQYTSMK